MGMCFSASQSGSCPSGPSSPLRNHPLMTSSAAVSPLPSSLVVAVADLPVASQVVSAHNTQEASPAQTHGAAEAFEEQVFTHDLLAQHSFATTNSHAEGGRIVEEGGPEETLEEAREEATTETLHNETERTHRAFYTSTVRLTSTSLSASSL
jgi:hypothetical protein